MIQLPELMLYFYQIQKKWTSSLNVTAKKKVRKHRDISVQERKNENFAQNDKHFDDDKLSL